MRILLLTHAFNSLAQRLFVALRERGHLVSVEFDINDRVSEEAVELFRPDLIVAPFLKRRIPAAIWSRHVCLIVHPGIPGDRGPSSLDWAILEAEPDWGVTVLQADAELDAGAIWEWRGFPMRPAAKSSLYRNEVAEAAEQAVLACVDRMEAGGSGGGPAAAPAPGGRGRLRPAVKQADRAIDWRSDDSETVLRKIRSADGRPGVRDEVLGVPVWLYDGHGDDRLLGPPGTVIARREGAICRATADGAVWIGHLRLRTEDGMTFKLPAEQVLAGRLGAVPEVAAHDGRTWQDIRYHEDRGVGVLDFAFYNGALSTRQCERLRRAYAAARRRDIRVLVLMGGPDFWANGMHLNVIEAAPSAADESWRNINAIDDFVDDILVTGDRLTIAALQGNAGAGGVFLALAADRVIGRRGIVLNPHYKGMGNLYGSEYWTYLLPRRAGAGNAAILTEARLPMGVAEAKRLGLVDAEIVGDVPAFRRQVLALARDLAADPALPALLRDKQAGRAADEAAKPLAAYRRDELERMRLNFYGFDPSYHVARYNFVHAVAKSRTPLPIALHRRRGGGAHATPLPARASPHTDRSV
jgi:putative two-component system hydrogenase maturation factor HypX/HoxX